MAPAGTGCASWPAGWIDARAHVPAIWSVVNRREPVASDGDVGAFDVLEQPAKKKSPSAKGTNKRALSFMATRSSKVSASRQSPSAVAGTGHDGRGAVHYPRFCTNQHAPDRPGRRDSDRSQALSHRLIQSVPTSRLQATEPKVTIGTQITVTVRLQPAGRAAHTTTSRDHPDPG